MAKLELLQADYKTLSRTVVHISVETASLFYERIFLFVMIGTVVQDGHGPVQLFYENQTNHLMRESHFGK